MWDVQTAQLEKPHGLPQLRSACPRGEDCGAASGEGPHGSCSSSPGASAECKTRGLDVCWLHIQQLRVKETVPPMQHAEAPRVGVLRV